MKRAPGGVTIDRTPKIINLLKTDNTAQFKKQKLTERFAGLSSTFSSTFNLSWRCGSLEKSECLFLVFRQLWHPLVVF
jgi:hypothetical protein